jgi:CPA2 family monovalent cation:H+ antiporter-2
MLQNRGEFALILATLATAAGLDPRLTPFAGLYVLILSIIGPVLAVNSDRMGAVLFRSRRAAPTAGRDRMSEEEIALVEAMTAGIDDEGDPLQVRIIDPVADQAAQQSDVPVERKRDPEY